MDRSRMIVAGHILHVFGLLLMSWMTSRAGGWVPLFFMSVGTGLAVSAATAESGRLGRIYGPGALIGLFNTAMSFGTAGGPLLAGFVYDRLGLQPVFREVAASDGRLTGYIKTVYILYRYGI